MIPYGILLTANRAVAQETEKMTVEKIRSSEKIINKELQKKLSCRIRKTNWEELTFETNKITLLSNPIESENKEPWMWYSLHRLMMSGKQATIYTPYIICGREMYDDLSQLTDNNVSVEIITNVSQKAPIRGAVQIT